MQDAVNIEDVRQLARRRLPRPIFDTLEGGAGDEVSLRANRSAFEAIKFRPKPLADVSKRDLSTSVFGEPVSMPIMLAPTGAGRMARSNAELAVARAAAKTDSVYMQSTVAAYSLEDVAKSAPVKLWFQLYLPRTREETEALVGRVAAAGYRALVITIDTPVFGNREGDARSKLLTRKPWHPQMALHGAIKPGWAVDFMKGTLGVGQDNSSRLTMANTRATILSSSYSVTWEDIEFIRSLWDGPLLIKGLMRGDESDRLVAIGVDGVVVSNHGGRQLDGVPGTVEVLPEIVDAAAGRFAVFLDGGIRRGVDVVKALALGANGVFVGRPYLYGLAADGENGVVRVMEMLRAELDKTLALVGAANVNDLDRTFLSGYVSRSSLTMEK